MFALATPGIARADHGAADTAPIVEGQPTLAPLAFVRFCMNNRRECPKGAGANRIALTSALARQLGDVNTAVNAGIAVDRAHVGRIPWSVAGRSGDCNTFALHKRHRLLELGWPVDALSLAVVRLRSGTMHLVLVVRTDRGDLVLDNLSRDVASWTSASYAWVEMQSRGDPERWVEVSARARGQAPTRAVRAKSGVDLVRND